MRSCANSGTGRQKPLDQDGYSRFRAVPGRTAAGGDWPGDAMADLRHPDAMHQTLMVLLSIAAIWLAATVVPGPDFLATTRVALTNDRATGIRTVLGIACGTCVWGFAGFFGIHALFTAAPWLYLALKLGGGAYLIFLGIRLAVGSFGGRPSGATHLRALSARSAFRLGLISPTRRPPCSPPACSPPPCLRIRPSHSASARQRLWQPSPPPGTAPSSAS